MKRLGLAADIPEDSSIMLLSAILVCFLSGRMSRHQTLNAQNAQKLDFTFSLVVIHPFEVLRRPIVLGQDAVAC